MHETITEHVSYERAKNSYEQQLSKAHDAFDHVETQLEELLFLVGDRPRPATEDEIMNYVIGMIESVKIKRERLKSCS